MKTNDLTISTYSNVTSMLNAYVDSLDDVVSGNSSTDKTNSRVIEHMSKGLTSEKAAQGAMIHYGALLSMNCDKGESDKVMSRITDLLLGLTQHQLHIVEKRSVAMAHDLAEVGITPPMVVQRFSNALSNPEYFDKFNKFEA